MLRLRGHHLICMQQFQGLGYNEEFTENMIKVIATLNQDLIQEIIPVHNMDDICAKCPNKLSETKCALSTPGKDSSEKDKRVLEALDLASGEAYSYQAVLDKITDNLDTIYDICCKGCGWEQQGVCSKQILSEALKKNITSN